MAALIASTMGYSAKFPACADKNPAKMAAACHATS
jgi:hypothetical protein